MKYTISHRWLNKPIRIALVGCGGTGSEMIDELFRIDTLLQALGSEGLHVTAFDPDNVSLANIGRQRFWPCDVNLNKAEVLITRINNFGGAMWQYSEKAFDIDCFANMYFDIIITCVDTPVLRAEIGREATSNVHELLWLDCGNDSSRGNVILGHIGKTNSQVRLPNVFDLYPSLEHMKNSGEPSCSTADALEKQDYGINRGVAREGANLLWQLLRHGSIEHHGSYIDLRAGSVTPLMIDEAVWSAFKT